MYYKEHLELPGWEPGEDKHWLHALEDGGRGIARSVGSGHEVGSGGTASHQVRHTIPTLGWVSIRVLRVWCLGRPGVPRVPTTNRPEMETTLHSFTILFPAQRRIQAFHIHAKKA